MRPEDIPRRSVARDHPLHPEGLSRSVQGSAPAAHSREPDP